MSFVSISHLSSPDIVVLPASKSYSQRALAAALLHRGITHIFGIGQSDDEKVALGIVNTIADEVISYDQFVSINSFHINSEIQEVYFGNSGLSSRMFIPVLATLLPYYKAKLGTQLNTRSFKDFEHILPQLNVQFTHDKLLQCLEVKGILQPYDIHIDKMTSSQYITGLLIAYFFSNINPNAKIIWNKPLSLPYINMTHALLEKFRNQPKEKILEIKIEGDWSNAAYWIISGCLFKKIKLQNLQLDSIQGDKFILDILKKHGADLQLSENEIIICPAKMLPIEADLTDYPDLFPPLVALAAHIEGITRLYGVHRLYDKESNRAKSLQLEFAKLGIKINYTDDCMDIIGGTLTTVVVPLYSHNDHRIAMALAIACMHMTETITLTGAEAVNKSYPSFWSAFSIEIQD